MVVVVAVGVGLGEDFSGSSSEEAPVPACAWVVVAVGSCVVGGERMEEGRRENGWFSHGRSGLSVGK